MPGGTRFHEGKRDFCSPFDAGLNGEMIVETVRSWW